MTAHAPKPGCKCFRVRPSWRGILPQFAVALSLCVGVVAWSVYGTWAEPRGSLFEGAGSSVYLLVVVSLMFVVLMSRPVVILFDSVYVVGRHHLYAIRGRLSLRRYLTEIPYEDMRGVRCEQSIVERVLNIGRIVVWTASADRPAVAMRWISAPARVTDLILHLIDRARLKRPHAAPGQDQEVQYRSISRTSRLNRPVLKSGMYRGALRE